MIHFLWASIWMRTNMLQPNTIGLALYDDLMGQLAWMAEKFIFGE